MKPPVIDLHQDLSIHLQHRTAFQQNEQTSWSVLAEQNVRVVVASAFPYPPDDNFLDPLTNDLIEADFRWYQTSVKQHAQDWQIIRDQSDLKQTLDPNGPRGLLLHIEGLNVAEPNLWDRLERWYALGWRSLGPVWILSNPFGGGTQDPRQGLTPLGRQLLDWISQHGVILDFAHMNAPTFWDAASGYRQPILITHTSAQALVPGPRSVSDEQLKRVAVSGGVAGVFFAGKYLAVNQPATVNDIVAHLRHFRDIMGVDHVALGTDMGGVTTGLVQGLESLDRLPQVWQALEQAGFTATDIEKIAYRNAQRVLTELLP